MMISTKNETCFGLRFFFHNNQKQIMSLRKKWVVEWFRNSKGFTASHIILVDKKEPIGSETDKFRHIVQKGRYIPEYFIEIIYDDDSEKLPDEEEIKAS